MKNFQEIYRALLRWLERFVRRDFEDDLLEVFGSRIKADESFCETVYSALANVVWINKHGAEFACTLRYAGGLISEIRGAGSYIDWYLSGPDCTVSNEIADGMAKLGWTYHGYDAY